MSDGQKAIIDIRNSLAQIFNEALDTHGPATTMTAVSIFAAAVVHQAEHLMNSPQARQIVLGEWSAGFHAYLDYLNKQCDGGALLQDYPPEGQA